MIASLTGQVLSADATAVVVSVGGVGFRVLVTPGVFATTAVGDTLTLHTSLIVRADALTLYGFVLPGERDCFELVQTASGIGPRIALAVVAVLGPAGLARAVRSENLAALTKVPGIGRKGAQKLVIELKDKVNALEAPEDAAAPARVPMGGRDAWREPVVSGLVGLGWSVRDAETACHNVAEAVEADPAMPVSAIMRAALSSLARV